MAKTEAVWGIDVGQCSLKALRCTRGEDGTMVATAFDYIEYPKILSQPDANPDELIKEALEQFLSRNEVVGDKVAISVSGQAGLSRFFKPPPVDAKTLPDIVKFEARQQIPFELEDVIWDYQQIGGKVIDGLTIDAEVGLFAMKREAVFKALQPFLDAEIEVDVVQLSPLTVYNVVLNDIMTDLPDPDDIDPKNPPESLVVIAMGTDTTDLVITDGYKLWLRNIPIGGNHFTKQLSRELKLTYAKAEHLKRNARKSEDPKTIFQAMRPVFSDLVTELQRSISYFQGIERSARIGHVAMFGNASTLPGLRQYLTKHLGIEITKFSEFKSLSGDSVVAAKSFRENFLSYSSCYGLCLQTLDQARLNTNLLPQEFVTERLIRSKKPWALASVGALLMGFTFHYFFTYQAWREVHPETTAETVSWKQAIDDVNSVQRVLGGYKTTDEQQMQLLKEVHEMESAVTGVTDGRRLWSESLSTIHQLLPPFAPPEWRPSDAAIQAMMSPPPVDPNVVPYVDRPDIYVEYVETEFFPNLNEWYKGPAKTAYETDKIYIDGLSQPPPPEEGADQGQNQQGGGPPSTVDATGGYGGANAGTTAAVTGPSGPGWVIEIKGHHYFNGPQIRAAGTGAGNYVRRTIMKKILDKDSKVWLPMPPGSEQKYMRFSVEELGFSYPALVVDNLPDYGNRVPNVNHPAYSGDSGAGGPGAGGPGAGGPGEGGPGDDSGGPEDGGDEPLDFAAPRYDFVLQIVWQPTGLRERLEAREARRLRQQANAANSNLPGAGGAPGNAGPPTDNTGLPTDNTGLPTGDSGQPAENPGQPADNTGQPANDPNGNGGAGEAGAGDAGAGDAGAGDGGAVDGATGDDGNGAADAGTGGDPAGAGADAGNGNAGNGQ